MAISETNLQSMVRLCADQPYTAMQLAKTLSITPHVVYNFLGTEKGNFYFKSIKQDGLRFYRADPNNYYLIKGKAKLKPHQKAQQQAYTKINETKDITDLPAKVGYERKQAIKKIWKINGFGQTQEVGEGRAFRFHSPYHKQLYDGCLDLFGKYVHRTNMLELCFEPLDDFFGATVVKPYATRFISVPRQIVLRENYEKAFKGGESQYDKGSFVTLTTDPKQFNNLWLANKYFQKNWNRLITNLRKKTGKELPYVCVREFQKNGRVHFHICIFGIHLPPTKKNAPYNNPISKLWKKYGQGQITDVKNLVSKDGAMQWLHDKPGDCKKDESPMKYLKKYLLKAQYDETAQFQYWIYNARYYTYSQSLHRTPKRRRHKPRYAYAGTIDREVGKFYRRKGSKGLQRHELTLGSGAPPPCKEISQDLQVINNLCQLA